jgi:hypothetical protein
MRFSTAIRQVFGHFHNLNLLALIHDLRNHQTARENWTTNDALLCPVAHGLANGQQVKEVNLLGEFANLQRACTMSANWLGADPGDVLRFVRSWDDYTITTEVLLDHLQQIWDERLADAEAFQEVLNVRDPDGVFDVLDSPIARSETLVPSFAAGKFSAGGSASPWVRSAHPSESPVDESGAIHTVPRGI